jgi:hypothetical protein
VSFLMLYCASVRCLVVVYLYVASSFLARAYASCFWDLFWLLFLAGNFVSGVY